MVKNFIKIALRNLYKNKVFSLINILGLAIGIAGCILILLFVRNEWSYDRFHKNTQEIFRVSVMENYSKDQQFFNSITPLPLGPTLKDNFPEVKEAVRISDRNVLVLANRKSFSERIHLADPSLFRVFDFPIIQGSPKTALKELNSVIITRSTAKKYFDNENPIGRTMSIRLVEDYQDFTITAVAEDPPVNSSIQFNFIIPFEKSKDLYSAKMFNSWTNIFCETYILTIKGINSSQLEAKAPALVKTIMGEDYKPGEYNLKFQPLKDIHLDTSYPVGLEPVSNPQYSYILSLIAVIVLIIASVNFITLSIGRSAGRAAEVGIRKVIGADRGSLIRQFWGESIIVVIISAAAAVVIAEVLLPYFNKLSGKVLTMQYDLTAISCLAGIIILIGLIAGIYPALILSSFNPVDVLKGKTTIKSRTLLRRILIAGQFTFSIIFISATFIIKDQLEYIQNKNLGFDKEHVLVIRSGLGAMETLKKLDVLREELERNKDIINVSASSNQMNDGWNFIGFGVPGGGYKEFFVNMVDYDFIKTLGIKLKAGRDFSKEYPNDARESVIVNEAFAKTFNVNMNEGRMPGNFLNNKIIGIVRDFNYESLHNEIKPAAIVIDPGAIFRSANDVSVNLTPQILIRIRPLHLSSAISFIRDKWEKLIPQVPFEFSFLDDDINSKYKSESRLSAIVSTSSVFAVLITCLGLLGLTMLITAKRTKEIGIRKVLGASITSILKLLTKEFTFLILIANIIALPAAYFLMSSWLEDFSYRISISLLSLLYSGIIVVLVSGATVAALVLKSAAQNPVKSLKYE